MDTEILAQKLLEFRSLLERYRKEVRGDPSQENAAQPEISQHTAFFLKPYQELLHIEPGDTAYDLPARVLDFQQHLIDDSLQQILLLQEILQNTPVGIAVISGPDLLFRLANAAYRVLLPDSQDDIIGTPFRQSWPEEVGFEGDRAIRQLLNSEKNIIFDRQEKRYPDGLTRNFSIRVCRLTWYGEQGALLLIQETTQADRSRLLAMEIAEEAHHQAKELDAIITAMAEAVTIIDARGVTIRANPAAIELFGIDPVGIDLNELVDLLSMRHPNGAPIHISDLPPKRALQGEIVTGQRLLMIDSESQERVILTSASPLFDEANETAIVTVWHDVTERERLLEQLEIEQSRLETIIKNAPEAILVADEDGRLVLGNPAAERVLGTSISYGQVMGSNVDLQICYNDGTPYDIRNLPLTCSALDGELLNNIELLAIFPDGQTRNILASTAPIVDRKGNLNGAVGIFQDITQRKQAEEELRHQASRSQLLAYLSQQFAEAGLHYRELLETIVRHVGRSFGDLCTLHLLDEDGKWYYPAAAFIDDEDRLPVIQRLIQDTRFPAEEGFTGRAFKTGQPMIGIDLSAEQVKILLPVAYHLFHNQVNLENVNALVVPLRTRGSWIGALSILRLQNGSHFTAEDQTFLQDLADRAALAIENTRLFEREAHRAQELQALHRATTALLSTIDLETLLAQILDAAQQAIPAAEQGVLYLLSTEDNTLVVRAAIGCHDLSALSPDLETHAYHAVREKSPLLLNNISPLPGIDTAKPVQAGSAIIAPLNLDQSVLGALALFGPHPKLFTENDLRLLDTFAATATTALQNATLYAEVQRLATTDTVTEQYNRRKFFEIGEMEMHRARRFHNTLSAIMLDLDNFKEINDTYGHGAGDQVLFAIAERCRASIRVVDILGRYGGDEFAILLPGAALPEAHEIAERIRQAAVLAPVPTDRGEIHISISLGIAQAEAGAESLSALLARADTALYNAKQGGRNRVMQE